MRAVTHKINMKHTGPLNYIMCILKEGAFDKMLKISDLTHSEKVISHYGKII